MSSDRQYEATLSHLHTAAQIHRDNHQQQLYRLSASADAEDRALHAERMKQNAETELRRERQEHTLTRRAMQRLVAQNIGLQRAVHHFAERWASHEGKSADALIVEIIAEGKSRGEAIEANPDNTSKLTRNVEAMREEARRSSDVFAWLAGP